jgi:hypothetical protein
MSHDHTFQCNFIFRIIFRNLCQHAVKILREYAILCTMPTNKSDSFRKQNLQKKNVFTSFPTGEKIRTHEINDISSFTLTHSQNESNYDNFFVLLLYNTSNTKKLFNKIQSCRHLCCASNNQTGSFKHYLSW